MPEDPQPVVIVRTGIANLASVIAGVKRCNLVPLVSDDPRDVERAGRLLLPGVGAFAPAMQAINGAKLADPLRDYARTNRPMLAICLGMQLLFERSDESPGVPGLAIAQGNATRFSLTPRSASTPMPPKEAVEGSHGCSKPARGRRAEPVESEPCPRMGATEAPGRAPNRNTLPIPQLGWNHVTPDPDCKLIQPGAAYFANSYRITDPPPGFAAARTDYGGPFISAIERGNLLACQFHPELSGLWGLALLKRWANGDTARAAMKGAAAC